MGRRRSANFEPGCRAQQTEQPHEIRRLMKDSTGERATPAGLCTKLGIARPVLLAPMAKIAGGRLAASVSDAGGLGLLGGGYGDLDWIVHEWRAAGGSRIGIGLITWRLDEPTLAAVLELQPVAVWLSFGEAAFGIEAIHEADAVAIVQVATEAEATTALEGGVDVLVAQGTESGGHGRPQLATLELVDHLSRLAPATPVVAAGGMTTRADFDRALARGASGVALGTAFYATSEAADVDLAKQQLVASSGEGHRAKPCL